MEAFVYDEENEEIEKYFIPTELTGIEKVNFICKKGYPIQKMALINRIPNMIHEKELVEYTFGLILEYIEIWDDILQIAFANAITNCYNNEYKNNSDNEKMDTIYYNTLKVINPLIKFCMKIISTEVNNISGEFLNSLNAIVYFYSNFRKIKIENDSIEYACNKGSFGKNVPSRRYSVYFCSSLIQISENFHPELFNRYMILSSDCEMVIKLEVAFNLRFIIREYLEEKFIKQNFIKLIDNFINEDETFLKSEIFVSVLICFRKLNDEIFLQTFLQKLLKDFDNFSHNDFIHFIKVFDCVVVEYENLAKNDNFIKSFYNIVKLFIRKYVINKDYSNNQPISNYDSIIDNFALIVDIIKINKEVILISEILTFIFRNFTHFQFLFIKNIHKIIKSIPNEDSVSHKLIVNKFSHIIEEKEGKNLIPILIQNFDLFLNSIEKNEGLIFVLISKFSKLEEYIQDSLLNVGWQETEIFFNSFSKSEFMFINPDFTYKIYTFIMSFIHKETKNNLHFNYKVVKSMIKVLPYIIKYSQRLVREEIIKFIEKEIVDNKSFFKRRLFYSFFKKSLQSSSINFLKENSIINFFIKLLGDNILVIKNLIDLIKFFYPLVVDESDLKFAIMTKLDNIRKIQNNDNEILKAIKEFDNWQTYYNKFPEAPEFIKLFSDDLEKLNREKIIMKKEIDLNARDEKWKNNKKIIPKRSNNNLSLKISNDTKKNFSRESTRTSYTSNVVKKSPKHFSSTSFRSVERKFIGGKDNNDSEKVKNSIKETARQDYSLEKVKLNMNNLKNLKSAIPNNNYSSFNHKKK